MKNIEDNQSKICGLEVEPYGISKGWDRRNTTVVFFNFSKNVIGLSLAIDPQINYCETVR
ncbi:uncharacterized protein PRCAT00002276001 [Priceomyces carsonii]|uniref:uncharacterized protein n=1 Tax=Priceomyces carsonii TaxID=28549 RepID=UPI002ED903E3|nr:unnamed protein product [Priceomyces carsonii]